MRTRIVQLVAVIGAATAFAAVSIASTGAGADTGGEARVPTTVPTVPASPAEGDEAPELAVLAKSEGISVDEAEKLFQTQAELSTAVESIMGQPEYVDFRFSDDGMSGRLLVAPDASTSVPFPGIRLPNEITVSNAVFDNATTTKMLTDVTATAEASFGNSFRGATYDAFNNQFIVAAMPSDSFEASASATVIALEQKQTLSGATVTVREIEPATDTRGGQRAARPGPDCTTGFGLNDNGFGAYLTAGHCGAATYTINGNVSTSTNGIVIAGYDDRMSIRAGGASWLVKISPITTVDMSSTAGHIFLNSRYCQYGITSNALRCGNIYEINHPTTTASGFRWGSVTRANCEPGDSGGPVWQFATPERLPKGIITARITANLDCIYVALDDQLGGTGWSLL